jgi:exodeoxyribonuclease VII large subunit
VTRAANSAPNSAENPFPVRAVAIRVAGWIDKLGTVWVEGQLAQINMRTDSKTVFMVLRDPAADMSLTVTCPRDLVLGAPVKLAEGTQVVVCGKPSRHVFVAAQRDSRRWYRRAAGTHRKAAPAAGRRRTLRSAA